MQLLSDVGPPPEGKALHHRMNPAGISYLYASSDGDTCVAELNPDVGTKLLLARFETTAPLRVVDLTKVPKATIRTIFDPFYDHNEQWAPAFMAAFSKEVSRPVRRTESTLEYVPTQVLAEYIRHIGYHGIRYRSSQRPKGWNLVIFDGPSAEPIRFRHITSRFRLWMTLAEVRMMLITSVQFGWRTTSTKEYHPNDFTPPEDEPF
jgi:RES domain-containing protein